MTLLFVLAACSSTSATTNPTQDGGPSRDTGPGVCFVDFPCAGQRFTCTGGAEYRAVESRDCTTVCPPGPCSGGVCVPVGPTQTCPSGTRCVDLPQFAVDSRPTPCEAPDASVVGDGSVDANVVGDSSVDARADATVCPLPESAAACAADDECATIVRGCYCGDQPVEGVNRRNVEAAAVCETRNRMNCAVGCAMSLHQRAQDGRIVADGGVIDVRCVRDGGVGRCVTAARP